MQRLIETRGKVDDADIAAVRDAKYSDAEILAIVTTAVVFPGEWFGRKINGGTP